MACLETSPQLYTKWCEKKSLKDKININTVEPENCANGSATNNVPLVKSDELEESEKKILALKTLLAQDLNAADFKWSLFVAACNTYRHDNCLKPFPSAYITDDVRDVEKLRKVVEGIPPLAIVYSRLEDPKAYETHKEAIDLLYWVLITICDPYLKSTPKENYESILSKVRSEVTVARPNLIFQLESPNQSAKDERWKASIKGHSTFYAYHGSRVENFHSIIHYGIQQHMSQVNGFVKYSVILKVYAPDYLTLITLVHFCCRKAGSTGIVGWFKQNKFLTFVLGYVVLLVSVGLSQNRSVEKYYRFFIQKVGLD